MTFEWDEVKERANQGKHGLDFQEAQRAFLDPMRLIIMDEAHSTSSEKRFFCLGDVDGRVMTVRFTLRSGKIRILGAAWWRKGRKVYGQ